MFKFIKYTALIFVFALSICTVEAGKKKVRSIKKQVVSVKKNEHCAQNKNGISIPYAYLIDVETGNVLYEHQAGVKMAPASMTKVLTAYVVMDKIKQGILQEDQLLTVSQKAFRREGTTMYLKRGQKVSILDLLKGLIIHSGNDAAVVLAEEISGSEEEFSTILNEYAQKLGMTNTHFLNASGIPTDGHYTTARDLAVAASNVHKKFPEYSPLWGTREYKFNGVNQINKNSLLAKNTGFDGMKTGRGENNSFGMIGTCVRNGRKLLAVVNGLRSEAERESQIIKLMEHGFTACKSYFFFKEKHIIDRIPVWYGQKSHVRAGFKDKIIFTNKNVRIEDIKINFSYTKTFRAPVEKGQIIGKMNVVFPGDETVYEKDIIALETVKKTHLFGRLYDGIVYLLGGRDYTDERRKVTPLIYKKHGASQN